MIGFYSQGMSRDFLLCASLIIAQSLCFATKMEKYHSQNTKLKFLVSLLQTSKEPLIQELIDEVTTNHQAKNQLIDMITRESELTQIEETKLRRELLQSIKQLIEQMQNTRKSQTVEECLKKAAHLVLTLSLDQNGGSSLENYSSEPKFDLQRYAIHLQQLIVQ